VNEIDSQYICASTVATAAAPVACFARAIRKIRSPCSDSELRQKPVLPDEPLLLAAGVVLKRDRAVLPRELAIERGRDPLEERLAHVRADDEREIVVAHARQMLVRDPVRADLLHDDVAEDVAALD
jgi:hypothetical protein